MLPGRLPCTLHLSGGSRPRRSVDRRRRSPTESGTYIRHMFLQDRSCTNTHRQSHLFFLHDRRPCVRVWLYHIYTHINSSNQSIKISYIEFMITYLGTESSPRSDFSGLQRTVMTELRPWSHEAVACVDLKERTRLGLEHNKNTHTHSLPLSFLLHL